MSAGRPVGNHIRNICATLEEFGPMGARELLKHYPNMDSSMTGRYCSRAVGLGLMTREPAIRGRVHYSVFAVVPDWQELAGQRRTTKLKPLPTPTNTRWTGVSSVFHMGAL